MSIEQIIDDIIIFSVGDASSVSDEEKSIFLKYINKANRYIHRRTASINERLFVRFAAQFHDGKCVLPEIPLEVKRVYIPHIKRNVTFKSREDIERCDPMLEASGSPAYHFYYGNTVQLYPGLYNGAGTVLYVKDSSDLTCASQDSDIPFPRCYHDALVYGALYFYFKEENSVKGPIRQMNEKAEFDKMVYAIALWARSTAGM